MRRLKVWTGTHPDELAAMKVGDSLLEDEIPYVKTDIANPLAKQLGRRWVQKNLILAYPGNPDSPVYEERRAAQVLQQSIGYYAVVDLHNINYFGENTAAVDKNRGVNPSVLGFLSELGIRHLITSEQLGLHAHTPNAFALETLASGLGGDLPALRAAFDRLANDAEPPLASATDFGWFEFYDSLHVDQVAPDDLSESEFASLRSFKIAPDTIIQRLGVQDRPVYQLSWRPEPNEDGYWGELVVPSSVPDDSQWPAA